GRCAAASTTHGGSSSPCVNRPAGQLIHHGIKLAILAFDSRFDGPQYLGGLGAKAFPFGLDASRRPAPLISLVIVRNMAQRAGEFARKICRFGLAGRPEAR